MAIILKMIPIISAMNRPILIKFGKQMDSLIGRMFTWTITQFYDSFISLDFIHT